MCSLANSNLFMFSTNLDDVSYDRLIWKRCNCGEGGMVQRSLQREKDSGDSGK